MAHAHSAPFIVNAVYGTRASTIVMRDACGSVRFVERRFDPEGAASGETAERFSIASGAGDLTS